MLPSLFTLGCLITLRVASLCEKQGITIHGQWPCSVYSV